jgi:hypothetical protein
MRRAGTEARHLAPPLRLPLQPRLLRQRSFLPPLLTPTAAWVRGAAGCCSRHALHNLEAAEVKHAKTSS